MLEEPPVYELSFSTKAQDFIELIPEPTQSKISSAFIGLSRNRFEDVRVKSLRGKIKELIVKRYRFTFFIESGTIYVVRGFVKKTRKTPLDQIELAEKRHREFLSINK